MRFGLWITMLIAIGTLTGCATISSTYLGKPQLGQQATGLPIVVERPRYVRMTISTVSRQLVLEKAVVEPTTKAAGSGNPAIKPLPGEAGGTATYRTELVAGERIESTKEISYEIISVGEVYAVDFKRPAAGTGEFTFEFEPGKQYPKKVTGKVEDKTIKELAEAVGSIAEKVIGLKPTSATTTVPGVTLVEISRTVEKVLLYDLDQLGNPEYQPVVLFPK